MLLQFLITFPLLLTEAEQPVRGDTRHDNYAQIDYWVEFIDHKLWDDELHQPVMRRLGMLAEHPQTREDIVAFLNSYEPQLELYDWGFADSELDEF